MSIMKKLKAIPGIQKYRYFWIVLACMALVSPFAFIPGLMDNPDLCGRFCMRRFYLYFPGMSFDDFLQHASVAFIGVGALLIILITTFFFGRIWCSFLCPMGGFPELVSRMINDRWKIEFRSLPQVPIRYGYFAVYVVLLPLLGVSACALCNFITVPRLFEALSGGLIGIAFIFSAVGLVNLALLFLLGFFANKGRAYCQFLCPIGAIDGLVNRVGAKFRFTHRIRVERDRCSGCNKCAKQCMTGAIKMVDRIAVVDQLSCMSCMECQEVCEWDAIKWTTAPKDEAPKRTKKNVEIHPLPVWTATYYPHKTKTGLQRINWSRLLLGIVFSVAITFVWVTQSMAAERHTDPDGCLSCHALDGLEYVDKNGLLRNASIDTTHYFSSLHGSIPCRDCHRKVTDFPHRVENTEVDCSASCHIKEPSKGESYTHKPVTEEYEQSVHGRGWTKGFTGGNRLEESRNDQNPSCRRCHSNTLYVPESQLSKFQDAFNHTETECGTCHQGDVWRNQFSGHILRRLVGARWDKSGEIAICNGCHANKEEMAKVDRHPFTDKFDANNTEKTVPADHRFIYASDSYAMTLHGRLIRSGVEEGASCLECHAPKKFRHGIRSDEDPQSTTHLSQRAETCASSNCHQFAGHQRSTVFVATDLHDADMLNIFQFDRLLDAQHLESWWRRVLLFLLPTIAIFIFGSAVWSLFGKKKKSVDPLLGSQLFESRMLNIKRKPKPKKTGKPKPPPVPKDITEKDEPQP